MIRRWTVHVEAHWGRLPRLRVRREKRPGDLVWDGGILCVLTRCEPCGEGMLARQLEPRVDRHARTIGTRVGTLLPLPADADWTVES